MIWNGKETSKWQIPHTTKEEYRRTFEKLVALGFVFLDDRIKSVDEVFRRFGFYYSNLVIGYHGYSNIRSKAACKMTLTGFNNPREDYVTISVDDWISNHWKEYDAA